jgi:16S rRNA (guanine966-N2)-methyltransferase
VSGAPGAVRIIGGAWRGRRVRFAAAGVRPTPDRVRETLFNWLQGTLAGACVLDLFAGSGALAFEALSRGAARAVLVERDPAQAARLRAEAQRLGAAGARVEHRDAFAYLRSLREREAVFDLAFLDPPFEQGVLGGVLGEMAAARWLAPGARIYVEHRARAPFEPPAGWHALRSGRAGEVGYHLLARDAACLREG